MGVFDQSSDGSQPAIIDEVQQFLNCRYISACEASWGAFGFPIHHRYSAVERLSFHLPNQQYVVYESNVDVSELVDNPRVCESQFLSLMEINGKEEEVRKLTYYEFPKKFVYHKKKREFGQRNKKACECCQFFQKSRV